jgi:ParB family chromosome partitioning protein
MSARAKQAAAPDNLIAPEIKVSLADIAAIDPCNVRSLGPDDLETLAASLHAHGQLHPLLVRMQTGGRFTVLAGGRRWRAFQVLSAALAGVPLRVRVRVFNGGDAEARAASLAENLARADLHPLDVAETFAREVASLGEPRVAHDFGLTRAQLTRKLRFALALSDRVKAKWRAGEIGKAGAEAFAVADFAAQDALLDAPDAAMLLATPLAIHQRLIEGSVPASSAIARFVGLEAFAAAGGEIAEDLFGGARLRDLALLRRMADRKLADAGKALCVNEGWGRWVDTAGFARVDLDLTADEHAELARLICVEADPGASAEALEAARATCDRLERLGALRAVPQSERHRFAVYVNYDSEGRLAIERGLDLAAARSDPPTDSRAGEPPAPDAPGATPSPDLAGGDEGVSADEPLRPRPIAAAFRSEPGRRALYAETADARIAQIPRRIAEKAASLAVADAIEAAPPGLAIAALLAAMVGAGPHRRPVRLAREHGPRESGEDSWLLRLAKMSFGDAMQAAWRLSADRQLAELATLVAGSIDLRGADPDYSRDLIAFSGAGPRICEHFDYPGFFAEATPATALRAIRDCGGEALERSHSWREPPALAREAAMIARARSWLPEFLGVAASPSAPAPHHPRTSGDPAGPDAPVETAKSPQPEPAR